MAYMAGQTDAKALQICGIELKIIIGSRFRAIHDVHPAPMCDSGGTRGGRGGVEVGGGGGGGGVEGEVELEVEVQAEGGGGGGAETVEVQG